MDNVLFIVNMQEMYAGKSRNKDKFSYDAETLIEQINKRMRDYSEEEIFYIKSVGRGLFKGAMPKADTRDADFATALKVRSKNIYEKNKADCFSNDALADFMRARHVKVIEFVGIDTGSDIGASALTATEDLDINVVYNEPLLIFMSPDKSGKYREKLKKTRVTFKQDWLEN